MKPLLDATLLLVKHGYSVSDVLAMGEAECEKVLETVIELSKPRDSSERPRIYRVRRHEPVGHSNQDPRHKRASQERTR